LGAVGKVDAPAGDDVRDDMEAEAAAMVEIRTSPDDAPIAVVADLQPQHSGRENRTYAYRRAGE
jgi:hypothetical protein